ncbi:MAG: hypothetical protein AAGI53_03595 [Planctomycetota bacterium]
MTKTVTLAALALSTGAALAGSTLVTTSDQGSTHGKTIHAFDFSGLSISEVYEHHNYQFGGNNGSNESGTSISQSDLAGDKINVFFADTTDGLGFFFVFDNGIASADRNTGSGTKANGAQGDIIFAPSGNQRIAVQDDIGDKIESTNGTDPFSFGLRWAVGFTDGIAGTFNGPNVDGQRSMTLALTSVLNHYGLTSVDGFNVLSADGSTYTGLFNDAGGAGEMNGYSDYLTMTAVPLPHPAALAGFGIVGVAAVRRRR